MEFSYYYGKEADQFSFIRIPKLLLTHEAFSSLSIQSKVLFGVLLDRMSLSMKNGWLDQENRVYIIYQIQEIQDDLGFSKKKAMDYLNELEQIGLIEKRRRGLGLPSILYVKSIMSGIQDADASDNAADEDTEPVDLGTSRSVDLGTSESADEGECEADITGEKLQNCLDEAPSTEKRTGSGVKSMVKTGVFPKNASRGVDLGTSRGVDLGTSRSIDSGTSRSAEIALQEVPVRAPLKNNTKTNNTYRSDIESNLIVSTEAGDVMRSDASRTEAYRKMIRENIEYDILLQQYPYDRELLDGIMDIILEVIVNQSSSMRIASATYPTELVKSRFLKLDSRHIQYVIDCFNGNTTKVGNIKKYLMTALFNAPSTLSGYYAAAVQHDFPQYAKAR